MRRRQRSGQAMTRSWVGTALALVLWGSAALPVQAQSANPQEVRSGQKILFEQPALTGIAGNFHVPPAEHKYPDAQPFNLVLWQPNPNRPDDSFFRPPGKRAT